HRPAQAPRFILPPASAKGPMMLPRLVDPTPRDPPSTAASARSSRRRRRDGANAGPDAAQPEAPPLHLLRHDADRPADAGLPEFDGLVFAPRRLRTGHRAFVQGQAFSYLHCVRTGSFKTVIVLQDGREQVSQFCFAGDLMGLDEIG